MTKASPEYIRECLTYEPETGKLFWREDRPAHHYKYPKAHANHIEKFGGKEATGSVQHKGYSTVSLGERSYYLHVLAYVIQTGSFPPEGMVMDHIDHDPTNNAWNNLRCTTQKVNAGNRTRRQAYGIAFHKASGKWQAKLGKQYLGLFQTQEEAQEVIRNYVEVNQ